MVLLNDVETELSRQGLTAGDLESTLTSDGESQCERIAKSIVETFRAFDFLLCSSSKHINKLMHRVLSYQKSLNSSRIKISSSLKERNFGVLNGSKLDLQSDLFTHTRICAENGESVNQCTQRAINFLKPYLDKKLSGVMVISHSFMCQYISNFLLQQKANKMLNFWSKKGACLELKYQIGQYNLVWDFNKAYNFVEKTEFSLQDILD